MIILTEIIVRKSAHALVVAERRVPHLLSTESNIPSFTVTIRIPKVTSTVIKKLPPNILGKHHHVHAAPIIVSGAQVKVFYFPPKIPIVKLSN